MNEGNDFGVGLFGQVVDFYFWVFYERLFDQVCFGEEFVDVVFDYVFDDVFWFVGDFVGVQCQEDFFFFCDCFFGNF